MALFNIKKSKKKPIRNRAGGEAYAQSPKLELVSMLLTSFAKDQCYRSADKTFKELIKILAKVDPKFAAKAGIYARTKFGMRSITHVLAAELAAYASGQEWAKSFYEKVIFRPDDMLEIIAYYKDKGGKTLPNAMRKGFANAFDRFDAYQLAKYKGERRAVKLIDVVNLVHPKPTARNEAALKALVDGTLKSRDTWEAKLSKAGQEADTAAAKEEKKAQAWATLIRENKLGYFALLRNIRNILEQAPELTADMIRILTDPKRIQKSMVLPFRYLTALEVLKEEKTVNRAVIRALNEALEISLSNVPKFPGSTLVVLDDSGSMTWNGNKNKRAPIEIGAIFAAVLYKANNADLMRFSDDAAYLRPYFGDATSSIADQLIKNAKSSGTNFHAIFDCANKAYDRIIILSDMQGWMGGTSPAKSFAKYKQRLGVDPFIYSFDLQGYGSLQFPEHNVFCLTGFSEKVFNSMKLLETDRNALIREIEQVQL